MTAAELHRPDRAELPSWWSAARAIAPRFGGSLGLVLSLAGFRADPSVVVTWAAVLGVLAIAVSAVVLARVAGVQQRDHDAWLLGTRRAFGALVVVTVLAAVGASLDSAPAVTLPVGVAVTAGAVLVVVDIVVESASGSRPRPDLLATDTRAARSVVLARWTWLALAITVGFTWIAVALVEKVAS